MKLFELLGISKGLYRHWHQSKFSSLFQHKPFLSRVAYQYSRPVNIFIVLVNERVFPRSGNLVSAQFLLFSRGNYELF